MSGPTTAIVVTEPVTALLAAAGIRAAMAVYESHRHAAELQEEHADANASRQAIQQTALADGLAALNAAAIAAEASIERLSQLADSLGSAAAFGATRPQRPQSTNPESLAAYVRGLERLAEELRTILLTEAGRQQRNVAGSGLIDAIAVPLSATQEVAITASQRLLARITHLGALPQDLELLARELDSTLPGERAELLATELRRRIQDQLDSVQQRQVQEATALIVGHTLKELGYQVEDVAETLFVVGGVVHFRRSSWGDYLVRLRVDAKASSVNFNVIRATGAGDNERSVLDHIAEDRWCAEFPALLKALEVQGVRLDVTRRLGAGELPVQLVERSKLPHFATEDRTGERMERTSQPLQRELK